MVDVALSADLLASFITGYHYLASDGVRKLEVITCDGKSTDGYTYFYGEFLSTCKDLQLPSFAAVHTFRTFWKVLKTHHDFVMK